MDQLSAAAEHPVPLINGDWSRNSENANPAVAQFQSDLANYKARVKEFETAKANADAVTKEESPSFITMKAPKMEEVKSP